MDHIYLINNLTNKFEKVLFDSNKSHDIITQLYYLKYHIPSEKDISSADNIVKKFYGKYSLDTIKTNISKIDDMIPLFNIYHANIYLINKENVYYRVVYGNYRFPGKFMFKYFTDFSDKLKDGKNDEHTNRKKRKIMLMLTFLNQLDIDELYSSYIKAFTKYSPYIGNMITQCNRPSFINIFTHLKPYYTRQELIKLALNMDIKLSGNPLNPDNINEICEKVSENDIKYEVLLSHQHHIVKHGCVGLIKYYTIQGSYFMNQYLRNLTSYDYKNSFMESIIRPVWNLILESPPFDNNYYVYRFIEKDHFIRDLKIGDIYEESGFMSTTRDPFYRSDIYKFGFILLKIKIPKNTKGVALCLETLSQFPSEQEIILPPMCQLKLIAKNEKCVYNHIDQEYGTKIRVRYEFDWIANKPIKFTRNKKSEENQLVDFLTIERTRTFSLKEKIKIFISKYLNDANSFEVSIGKQQFQLIGEWFNSQGAYKNFYLLDTSDGFSLYTILNGNVLFMIELADVNEERKMVVNYYLRYTNIERQKIIPEQDFIKFLACVANYFNISCVVIYSDFISCDNVPNEQTVLKIQRAFSKTPYDLSVEEVSHNKTTHTSHTTDEFGGITYYGGYHSLDVYNYLKNNIKRFDNMEINKLELKFMYSHSELDLLSNASPSQILNKNDNDEIYQIYLRNYQPHHRDKDNIKHFYLWIVKRYCYLVSKLVEKISRLYTTNNPFETIIYILHPDTYLYNRELIDHVDDSMVTSYSLKKTYSSSLDEYREIVDKIKRSALFI